MNMENTSIVIGRSELANEESKTAAGFCGKITISSSIVIVSSAAIATHLTLNPISKVEDLTHVTKAAIKLRSRFISAPRGGERYLFPTAATNGKRRRLDRYFAKHLYLVIIVLI